MSIISVDDTEYIDHDQNRTMYIVVPILKLYKIVKIPVGVLKSSRTCILIVQNILCFPAFWTILIVYMPGIVERARSQKRPKIFRTTYVNLYWGDVYSSVIGHQPSHPWVPSLWTLYPSHQDPIASCADLEGPGGSPLSGKWKCIKFAY